MRPQLLKGAGPFMQRTQRVCVCLIEHVAPVPARADQTDIAQHAQVLGDGGLLQPERDHDLANLAFAVREIFEDLAAARFGDCVECVGGGGCPCHELNNTYPYRNMSSDS